MFICLLQKHCVYPSVCWQKHTHACAQTSLLCLRVYGVCACMRVRFVWEWASPLIPRGFALICVAHMKRLIPPANHTTGQPKVSQRLHSCTHLAPLGWISKGMFSQWARPSHLCSVFMYLCVFYACMFQCIARTSILYIYMCTCLVTLFWSRSVLIVYTKVFIDV